MIFDEPDGATPLDPDEIAGLKFDHITTRGELDELEQANITQGLRWLGRRRGGDVLSGEFFRQLHIRLFGDVWTWAGTYRQREKNIGIVSFQIAVQIRSLLDDARYWVEHATYAPLEAAARFHHRMVQIHPFPNGNGRHARIAADIFLNGLFRPSGHQMCKRLRSAIRQCKADRLYRRAACRRWRRLCSLARNLMLPVEVSGRVA